jgi:hypothetical protein
MREVRKIICKDCIVKSVCEDNCELYCEVFNPIYKEMKTIEEKIGRRLDPWEVKQLAANNAKRLKDEL